jgi:hypothetical protein
MKKSILFFLGFALSGTIASAQNADEVQKYMMQVACECGGKAYSSAVPSETREFSAKIAKMEAEELTPFLDAISAEEMDQHLSNLMSMTQQLEASCSDADMKAKVLKKYPKAAATLEELAQDTNPEKTMALLEELPQCAFLKETLATMMALGMYQASKEEIIIDETIIEDSGEEEEGDED